MATESSIENDVTTEVWRRLKEWIRQQGGEVHESLELREISSRNHRGVFATRTISLGETLFRLPSTVSIDGRELPSVYKNEHDGDTKSKKTASPWLRCLASFYKAKPDKPAYTESLPSQYETVSEWDYDQVESFLSGTCTQAGSAVGWHADARLIRERYAKQIRPYLEFCDIFPPLNQGGGGGDNKDIASSIPQAEIDAFCTASACLSTRGFHLEASPKALPGGGGDAKMPSTAYDADETYNGPFLLPAIDLLNHASSDDPLHNTSLHRDERGFFHMEAEREILPNEEIFHSYGDQLTACQFLQTFGFVPESSMRNILLPEPASDRLTPALLTKQNVLETCWNVIESEIPARLARIMSEREMEDEVWTVSVDRRRTADFISDDLIVTRTQPLTDEIVTTACVPFLPICAYREAAQALIGKEILQDFFLGSLVCTSLLKVLQHKFQSYKPIEWQGQVYEDDAKLLRQLLDSSSSPSSSSDSSAPPIDSLATTRLKYALTLRLEEKACMHALRREVTDTMAELDEDLPDEFHVAKKPKLSLENDDE